MTKTIGLAPDATAIDPTTRLRRTLAAVALPVAFAFQLACNTIYSVISTESGLTDTGPGEETLRFFAMYPDAFVAASILAMVGVLLAVPGLLAALRVLRPSRPRLALVAVVLMVAGYICYFGIVTTNFDTVSLALLHPGAGDVLDASGTNSPALAFFLLFVVGNLVGTLLLGLAAILSREVPWYAGALIMGWPVGHVVNIVVENEWFAVAGGALEVVGLSIVAGAALRTSDEEWARRG